MTEEKIDLAKWSNAQLAPLLQGKERRLTDIFPRGVGNALRAKLQGGFAVNVPNLIRGLTQSGDPTLGYNAEPIAFDCEIFADPNDKSAVIIVNPTSIVVGVFLNQKWESLHIVNSSDYQR